MTLHAHFEALYAADDDPWAVRSSWYERRKRAVLLASLGRERYRSAFEPGCGNGELSALLALRCDALLACDGAAAAVAAARRRLRGASAAAVRIEQRSLPAQWPHGERFDLVVISELAYYFDAATAEALLGQACAMLEPDGELVLCHYLHPFDDRLGATETIHAVPGRIPGMLRTACHLEPEFLLECWRRRAP